METNTHHAAIDNIVNKEYVYPKEMFSGKGIVTCGGGQTYFTCTWILVNMLRYLGCNLPIEVWYLGKHEMNDDMISLMNSIPNVKCIDAYQISKVIPVIKLDGWELKIYAIKNSSFEEVLFLDSDNVPVKDPTYLFDCQEYREYHSIFWTDNNMYPTALPGAWEACNVTPIEGLEFESGQLLINKSQCWKALILASYFNENSDFFYHYLFGDKDTFKMAWIKTNTPYKCPKPPICLKDNLVIYQYDFNNKILFQHRSGSKWKFDESSISPPMFTNYDQCVSFLLSLRQKWNGIVRSSLNDIEKEIYNEICQTRKYMFNNKQKNHIIDLLPIFKIGMGQTITENCWNLYADCNDIPVITLGKKDRTTCFLRKENDTWKGLYLFSFREIVSLSPFKKL